MGSKKPFKGQNGNLSKVITFGVALLFLVLGFGVVRYAHFSFFTNPSLILSETVEMPYSVSQQGAFVLEFDQRMKKKSVEQALQITPKMEYEMNWEKNVLFIRPKQQLQDGILYYVSIASEAQNILGKPLKKSYTISYKRGEDPRIVEIFPKEKNITPDQKVVLIFSHPMIGESAVGKIGNPDFLQMSPLVPGEWVWRDSRVLVFTAKNGFPLSSRISLQSTKPIQTYDQTVLKEKISMVLETERLSLVQMEEGDKQEVHEPFRILFNQPIELKSYEKYVTVRNSSGVEVKNIKVEKNQHAASSYFISSDIPWFYDDKYTVSFSEFLMPLQGNLGLPELAETVIQTQSVLEEQVFQYSESQDVILSNGSSLKLLFREVIPVEKIQNGIRFQPEMPFRVKSLPGGGFELTFEDSQKRESFDLYISPEINTESKKIVSGPRKYEVRKTESMNVKISESPLGICISSRYPLERKSIVKYLEREWRVEKAISDQCLSEGYEYEFERKLLPPGQDNVIVVQAEDVFGQVENVEWIVTTPALKAADVSLESRHSTFYSTVSSETDLQFQYATTNVSRQFIQVCRISSETAMTVEGTYEEKWGHFTPSEETCLRYKAAFIDGSPKWGNKEEKTLDVKEFMGDVERGLYYVNISSPQFFDTDGKPVQARGVLNYTQWNLYSKRGASALVWLTEKSKPVQNALISLYASDGSVLYSGNTDRQGLFEIEKNRTKYEYIVAKKGFEEVVFNVFDSEGFEPHLFSVPFNTEEVNYRYQFFIENLERNNRSVNGVFIFKELDAGSLVSPKVNGVNVVLFDENELLLGRRFSNVDSFGNAFFEIPITHTLLDGRYQLGVCLGLFEGVCHGTYLWTTLQKGSENKESYPITPPSEASQQGRITLDVSKPLKAGEDMMVTVKDLKSGVPALLTVERDAIYFKKIIIPESSEVQVSIPLTSDMVPEVMVSLAQFNEESVLYDLKNVRIPDDSKTLTYKSGEDKWTYGGGESREISEITVRLNSSQSISKEMLLRSFYPRIGTSIITSANTGWSLPAAHQENFSIVTDQSPDLVMIDGSIQNSEKTEEDSYFIIAHDASGNFGSVTLSQKREEKELDMTVDLPEFMRDGDQIVLDIRVVNHSKSLKNVQLKASSLGVDFLSGDNALIGIPAEQDKQIRLATKFSSLPGQKSIPFQVELLSSGVLEAEFQKEVQIVSGRSIEFPTHVLPHESNNGSGVLELSTGDSGDWKNRFIISGTPFSYVLENINKLLQKESLSFDESIYKRIVEANYSQIMKDSWIQNDLLKHLSDKNASVENLLYYLESRQKNDGGWSLYPEQNESDPILSSWMAKSLSSLEQAGYKLPELMRRRSIDYQKGELDKLFNERVRSQTALTDVSEKNIFDEMQILNGLSSLNPSGISYANTWYNNAEKLPNHSLVLLLLTLEDYRDAGVVGMNFKIEEIIQLLKSRQQHLQQQTWLTGDSSQDFATDFLTTSWYLDALVRQASARDDIPSIITWLSRNKYQQKFQSPLDQFSFLQAMASYLRIYQEQVNAGSITVQLPGNEKTFELIPGQPFQSFFVENIFTVQEEMSDINSLRFSTDTDQPLFIEANWKKIGSNKKAVNNGISLYQEYESGPFLKGDTVRGTISIITPKALRDVVVAHPIISGAIQLPQDEESTLWKTKSFGADEKWYLFPELPAGETIIHFEWEMKHAGIFTTPQVQAHVISQPKTLSSSNTVTIEVRNGEK
jgi:hypothetical protein